MLSADIMAFSKLQASMQWQKSRVNWLKEGDANIKFYHGIMSSRKRSNSIISLMVDGVQIEGVDEVRQTMFQHFHDHFQRLCMLGQI
jgi:Zn-dependent M16 (insulinase) family peptidase